MRDLSGAAHRRACRLRDRDSIDDDHRYFRRNGLIRDSPQSRDGRSTRQRLNPDVPALWPVRWLGPGLLPMAG